jgi:predicted RNase H-like HicB family nuclease
MALDKHLVTIVTIYSNISTYYMGRINREGRIGMSEKKSIIGFKIDIIVEPDESGFHAYCPALKGLHTAGDTREEALQNARDAAIAYLESLIKHNDPIPVGIIIRADIERSSTTTTHQISHYTEDLEVACAI